MPYEVPADGHVVFYRLVPAAVPGEKPVRVNVADVRMTETGPFLVFMADKPETKDVFAQVIDDSWEVHPVGTIRVFSYSRRLVVVKIKDVTTELKPTEWKILPFVAGGQFWLQAATKDPVGWEVRISAPQVAPPKARITAILFDQQPSEDRPVTHELQLAKFIDVVPQPPAP